MQLEMILTPKRFDGADYVHERDCERLTTQLDRVRQALSDGRWHTLRGLAATTGDPEASVSAQLRHLRKPRFGSHNIERQHISHGLYEYRMVA